MTKDHTLLMPVEFLILELRKCGWVGRFFPMFTGY